MSLSTHAGIFGAMALMDGFDFFRFDVQEDSVVEVSFGLEIPPVKRPMSQTTDPQKASSETPELPQATKQAQQLPQLPTRFEVETRTEDNKDDNRMPPPQEEDDLELTQKLPESAQERTSKRKNSDSEIIAEERDPDAQKVKFEEVQKRLEREQRKKVANEAKEGQVEPPREDEASALELPANPFEDPSHAPLPDTPDPLAPTGSLQGKRLASSASEAYKTSAVVHMKRFWSIPDFYVFPQGIRARAVVVINVFGKILSAEIEESSGNAQFDQLVIQQVRRAEPFPDLPSGLGRTQKLYMDFEPNAID